MLQELKTLRRQWDALANELALLTKMAQMEYEIAVVDRMLDQAEKAGYRPEQPRVPRGNPHGGQWVGDGDRRLPERLAQGNSISANTPEKQMMQNVLVSLRREAKSIPQYKCLSSVRKALNAGGFAAESGVLSAKSYGPNLEKIGFKPLVRWSGLKKDRHKIVGKTHEYVKGYSPQAGDVVIIQNYFKGSIHGHIAIFDGHIWISDFRQKDLWSGAGYRREMPAYVIYRHPNL